MADKTKKFENPDAIKFSMDKNSIIMNFAYSKNEKNDKYIDEDNIQKVLSISFEPESFIFTIAVMLKAVEDYQKKYNVDLGIRTHTEELSNEK